MTCVERGCTTPVGPRALRCKLHAQRRRLVLSKLWHREHQDRVLELRAYYQGKITRAQCMGERE